MLALSFRLEDRNNHACVVMLSSSGMSKRGMASKVVLHTVYFPVHGPTSISISNIRFLKSSGTITIRIMAHLTRTITRRLIPSSLTPLTRQSPTACTSKPITRARVLQPQRSLLTLRRNYHSTLHARLPDHEYTNSQTVILTAALSHVPAHGFTAKALTLGARDAGFLDVSVQLLPRGEFDLILFWLASRRGILRGKVEEGGLFRRIAAEKNKDVFELSVEERVRGLLLERLRMNQEIKSVWQDVRFSFLMDPRVEGSVC